MSAHEVATIAGERLRLLPERVALWERERTLLVADAHFGKAAAFRAAGVPVPRGTTAGSLERLDAALSVSAATRIVFLGDFLHAREGRAMGTLGALAAWRARHAVIDMILVRGNHDAGAGDPPHELDVRCVDGPLVEAPFVFAHRPKRSNDGYVVCGHVHPAVRLEGPAREHSRLPCFWFGTDIAVLPAFGEFTGLGDIVPKLGDRVWVAADGVVVRVDRRDAE